MPTLDDDGDDFDPGSADDEVVTIPCPHCRRPIWEESVACEHCGKFVTAEARPWRREWWLILGVVACLVCVYLWLRR